MSSYVVTGCAGFIGSHLVEALLRSGHDGKTRVVFASSSSVYGRSEAYPTPEDAVCRPISPYGVTKLSCEHMARAYEACFALDVVSLRFFTVYGPRQRPDMLVARIVTALHAGTPFQLFGTGEQSRSFTYVSDAVDASIQAMELAPSGATFNVGGGEEASIADVIRRCERLSGRKLNVRRHGSDPRGARVGTDDDARLRPRCSTQMGRWYSQRGWRW